MADSRKGILLQVRSPDIRGTFAMSTAKDDLAKIEQMINAVKMDVDKIKQLINEIPLPINSDEAVSIKKIQGVMDNVVESNCFLSNKNKQYPHWLPLYLMGNTHDFLIKGIEKDHLALVDAIHSIKPEEIVITGEATEKAVKGLIDILTIASTTHDFLKLDRLKAKINVVPMIDTLNQKLSAWKSKEVALPPIPENKTLTSLWLENFKETNDVFGASVVAVLGYWGVLDEYSSQFFDVENDAVKEVVVERVAPEKPVISMVPNVIPTKNILAETAVPNTPPSKEKKVKKEPSHRVKPNHKVQVDEKYTLIAMKAKEGLEKLNQAIPKGLSYNDPLCKCQRTLKIAHDIYSSHIKTRDVSIIDVNLLQAAYKNTLTNKNLLSRIKASNMQQICHALMTLARFVVLPPHKLIKFAVTKGADSTVYSQGLPSFFMKTKEQETIESIKTDIRTAIALFEQSEKSAKQMK